MLALNYLSFVVSGGIWRLCSRIKADYVFIFEVSPMTQALPGVWYAKRRQIPCYLYVQDLWPDNVEIITGIHNKTIIGSINKMVQYIYKRCKRVFVTSQSFKKRWRREKFQPKKWFIGHSMRRISINQCRRINEQMPLLLCLREILAMRKV